MKTPRSILLAAAMLAAPFASFAEVPNAHQLALEGTRALEQNDLATARDRFRSLLKLDANNVAALTRLGMAEYKARNFEEAELLLRQAARLQPDSAAAWLTLGVVASDAGKLDTALAALSRAVLLDPTNAKAHCYLGVTVGRKGWLDGAEDELLRAIKLNEAYAEAHFNLAVVYLQRNPPAVELARRHYQRALELGAASDSLVEKQLETSKK